MNMIIEWVDDFEIKVMEEEKKAYLKVRNKTSKKLTFKGVFERDEKVLIETEPKQYLEFDGDSYPMTTPIKVECLQNRLKLIK